QGAVFVYAKPTTGWSGSPTESAVLTASHAQAGDGLGKSLVTAGPDIVAGDGDGRLDAFTEPAGGWTGEIHETAVLSASDGMPLSNPVVSGNLLVAQGTTPNAPGAVYVFVEPSEGWSGVVHEGAKLTASDGTSNDLFGYAIAVSGTTIVVGAPGAKVGSESPGAVYVFT